MTANPYDDPEWVRYADHIRTEVIPMIAESAYTVQIAHEGEPDVKIAVELGLSILLDKPIVLAIFPGRKPPARMLEIADAVWEFADNDAENALRMQAAMEEADRKRAERRAAA